jgi:DNA repair protein RecO (recombination protein O)
MAVTETEAIIIRSYNLAEADKIVVCLTRSAGLVRAVAKGSRKIKNRFGAALEPFTLVNISYYHKENQELASLRQAEILKSHFNISIDPDALTGLAYMGDLVVDFSPPHQPNDKVFRMLSACLDAVSEHPDQIQLILRYFEVWILKLEGFLPDLWRCADCQRSLIEEPSVFISRELGFVCPACVHGKGEVLSAKAYACLCASQKLNPTAFAKESQELSNSIHRELAELLHRMLGRVLERRPRVRLTFQPLSN